jgi:hypothetical protein
MRLAFLAIMTRALSIVNMVKANAERKGRIGIERNLRVY